MKRIIILLLLLDVISVAEAQIIKRKEFTWDGIVPASPLFRIDNTYSLYIRRICRSNGNGVATDDCNKIPLPNTLVEIQYLYYSPVHRVTLFIMLLPNYPQHENGEPTYNRPEIRNAPVVNLWSANCFLFGKMNSSSDTISFRRWDSGSDRWAVKVDETNKNIEITGLQLDGESVGFTTVKDNLSVNVVYRLAESTFPMNVDGTMFDRSFRSCSLQQVFYYEKTRKGYRLHIPYDKCQPPSGSKRSIFFEGRKNRANRIPYDPVEFFK